MKRGTRLIMYAIVGVPIPLLAVLFFGASVLEVLPFVGLVVLLGGGYEIYALVEGKK